MYTVMAIHSISQAQIRSRDKYYKTFFALSGPNQIWARYLEGDNILTKTESGRDRDWGGLLDFLKNQDRDWGGLPD